MKMKKRLLALGMTIAMVFGIAGCGGSGGSEGGDTKAENTEAESTSVEEGSQEQGAVDETKAELSFWHVFTDDAKLDIVNDYIEIFNQKYPNVKVEQVYVNDEEYVTKLKVAASTGSQGDVFFAYGAGQARAYVDAGVVKPLDDLYAESGLNDKLLGGTLTYCTYDDKVYGIPLKQWAGVLYCNQKLFDENNVEIPKTWEEFQAAIKTFKENGITPLALGGGDAWHIAMYQNALAVRFAGVDYCNEMLAGNQTFVTDEIIQSAQAVIDLNNEGAFTPNTLGYSSEEAEAEFYMGNVAMFYGGSWSCAVVDNPDNATSGNCTVSYLPTVNGGKGDETTYSGGVIDFLMLNENTKNPELAFEFATGIAEYMSTEFYKMGDSLPAWEIEGVDESEISPTLQQIQNLTENATGYVLAWDTFLDSSVTETHYNTLQGLLSGEVTAEGFAKSMQESMDAFKASKAD